MRSRPAKHQAISDVAVAAARAALQAASCRVDEVECVIVATQMPECASCGVATILAAKLGLVGVPALDVRHQCSGFVYGLSVADHFVRLGTYRRVLVIGTDFISTYCDSEDQPPAGYPLGDGGGAAIVAPEVDERRGILATGLHADGRYGHVAGRDDGVAEMLPSISEGEMVAQGFRRVSESVGEALESCGLCLGDVRLFIPSASCAPIASRLCRLWGVPPDRMYMNTKRRGSTMVGSLPISLDEVVRSGRLRARDVIVLLSFGAGLTWGWAVLKW
jgi:3-oxoacyl-[acyl-carrier-protein] synthase-3